jgi:hypothetical protein
MQFFLDVMNGALDVGTSMAEMSATALDALAGLIEGMAGFMEFLPGVDSEATDAMKAFAESARTGADVLRTEVPAALDETRNKINEWAGPELMKARVHDATVAMAGDMDAFSAKVDASGGTVTINGETLTAEQALDVLVANIDGSDGTVSINGNRVPADQALSALMGAVRASRGSVTVGANTAAAESAIANLTRDRYVRVYAVGMSTLGGTTVGPHDGGWTPMGGASGPSCGRAGAGHRPRLRQHLVAAELRRSDVAAAAHGRRDGRQLQGCGVLGAGSGVDERWRQAKFILLLCWSRPCRDPCRP